MKLERKDASQNQQYKYAVNVQNKAKHTNKKKRRRTKRQPDLLRFIRQAMKSNPNFNSQLLTVLITLTSGNVPVDREIDNLTEAIEKIRHVTEIVDKTMQSVKVATEAPRQIRQIFE